MDINFELYKVFYYVAKYLSFSEASKYLYISQSAVSQSIALLEEKLDCKLLFRNTKQVKLTREGEVLFEYIEQAFNFIKTAERNLSEIKSIIKGDVRIAASDTICKYYLLPYFKKFSVNYPGIKIHVTNRTSPQCVELLKKGSVDFSVVNISEKQSYGSLNVDEIKTIQDIFIAGSNYSHLKGKEISLKELEQYPVFVLEGNSTTREYFDELIIKNNVNITPEIELGSVDLLVELAKIGLGISYVMSDCIENEVSNGNIFVLDTTEKMPERKLGIITHKGIPLPAAAKRFIEMLKANIR
jgi:Transcriptional regulator